MVYFFLFENYLISASKIHCNDALFIREEFITFREKNVIKLLEPSFVSFIINVVKTIIILLKSFIKNVSEGILLTIHWNDFCDTTVELHLQISPSFANFTEIL